MILPDASFVSFMVFCNNNIHTSHTKRGSPASWPGAHVNTFPLMNAVSGATNLAAISTSLPDGQRLWGSQPAVRKPKNQIPTTPMKTLLQPFCVAPVIALGLAVERSAARPLRFLCIIPPIRNVDGHRCLALWLTSASADMVGGMRTNFLGRTAAARSGAPPL